MAEGLSTGRRCNQRLRSGTGSGQLGDRFFARLPRPGLRLRQNNFYFNILEGDYPVSQEKSNPHPDLLAGQ